jgi:hypothetical protein
MKTETGNAVHDNPAPAPDADGEVISLYQAHKKIYPRSVSGVFANWRWGMVFLTQIVFYGLPWLEWGQRQMVLFDLGARRFYIFGLVLYPQDFIYLTGMLVVSALSLFLFTAVAGRLWCGYACPQTVYTEIFLWIERKFEGDRSAQMRRDAQPLSLDKAWRKAGKQLAWVAVALWTGFTFVGYFTPIRSLGLDFAQGNVGPGGIFWTGFYGFATYGNAGFMREQVCKYMCPYARFQSAMFDKDTLIVTYDTQRGEPRGARSRKADPAAEPGRLHRLHPVRAGLPDRHRHPQGPAVRVHRLRRLCRRLRHGDGQDGLRPGSGQVHHRERHEEAVDPGADSAPCAAAPHPDLHLDPAGDRDRHGRQHGPAHTVQGQRGARSWRPGAYRRARADRERLPAADHECHRGDAKVPDHRRGSAGSGDRVRERRDRRFHTGRAAGGAGAGTL